MNALQLNFTLKNIYIFSFYLVFGIYGSLSLPANTVYSNLNNLTFLFILVFLLICKNSSFESIRQLRINRSVITSCIIIFISLYIIQNKYLEISLFSDEISYAGKSSAITKKIIFLVYEKYSLFGDYTFKYIQQFLNFILLSSFIIFFWISKNFKYKYLIYAISFFFLRFLYSFFGGNPDPHPPGQLFPLFIGTVFFGINDFVYRAIYVSIFSIFVCYMFNFITCYTNIKNKIYLYLIFLLLISFYIFRSSIGLIDHAVFSFFCFSIIVLNIIFCNKKIHYSSIILFICIMSLFRISCFISVLPILFIFIYEKYNEIGFKQCWYEIIKLLIPTLLFIPFLINNSFNDLSSTDMVNNSLQIIIANTLNNIFNHSFINHFNSYTSSIAIIFVLVNFIYLLYKKRFFYFFVLSSFFILIILMYYCIKPSLLGYAKYQLEIFFPFILSGIIIFSIYFKKFSCILFFSICIVFNIFHEKNKINSIYDPFMSFKYKQAFTYIISNKMDQATYSLGRTYDVYQEIIYGYPISHVFNASINYKNHMKFKEDYYRFSNKLELLFFDKNIKYIILGSSSLSPIYSHSIKPNLLENWIQLISFNDTSYDSSVTIFKRK